MAHRGAHGGLLRDLGAQAIVFLLTAELEQDAQHEIHAGQLRVAVIGPASPKLSALGLAKLKVALGQHAGVLSAELRCGQRLQRGDRLGVASSALVFAGGLARGERGVFGRRRLLNGRGGVRSRRGAAGLDDDRTSFALAILGRDDLDRTIWGPLKRAARVAEASLGVWRVGLAAGEQRLRARRTSRAAR